MGLGAVVEIMGGKKVMDTEVHNTADLISITGRGGIAVAAVKAVQDRIGVSNELISDFLGISASTLQRQRRSNKKLDKEGAEKLYEISSVIARGIDVFEEEAEFNKWLRTKNPSIGGVEPIKWMGSAIGRDEILQLLNRIEHGIYS